MKSNFINILTGLLVCAVLLFLPACSDDNGNDGAGPAAGLKISSTDQGATISEDGTTANVTIPAGGGSVELSITADQPWTLSDRDDEWCVLTGTTTRVRVSAEEFGSDYNRATMIRIMVGEKVAGYIHVSQDGTGVANLQLSEKELIFPELGGEMTVEVVTNKNDWTVTGHEGLEWIDITKGEGLLTVRTVTNDVPYEFSTTLTVTAGSDGNSRSRDIEVYLEPWTPVYLDLGRDLLVIPEEGGEIRIPVLTNRQWTFSSSGSWLTVVKDGNEVVITVPASSSGNLEAEIFFETTSGKDHADFTLPVKQFSNPLILEFTMTSDILSMAAPLVGEVNCYVDWGDGTSTSFAGLSNYIGDVAMPHTYETPGVYEVKIYGTAEGLRTDFVLSNDQRKCVTALKAWGSLGFTVLDYALSGTSIKTIPAGYREIFRNATTMESCFAYCEQLETVPSDLFNDLDLEYMPALFFGCTSLKEIPATLFAGSTNIREMQSLFRECYSLKTVPEGLFDGMTELENVLSLFYECTSLETVPVNLFDNNRKITNFIYAFYQCTSLRGESPYTTIGSAKVHLYERENYPGEFAEPTAYFSCFEDCTRLEDYSNIPDGWKEW